jgi:hypothetical protein
MLSILKDILRLDYGLVHTPINLFRCEWVKQKDNQSNPTYVLDEVGFLIINFRHKLPIMFEPFIFPFQVTQVFFLMTLRGQVGRLC